MYLLAILGRRVLQIMATVLLVAVLVFTLMHMLPGDPAQVMLGDRGSTAAIAQLHHDLGLDRSIPVQFWEFLKRIATLNLGESVTMRIPVTLLIAERLPITLLLTAMAAVPGSAHRGSARLSGGLAAGRLGRCRRSAASRS